MISIFLISEDKVVINRFQQACKKVVGFEIISFTDMSGLDTIRHFLSIKKIYIFAIHTEKYLDFVDNICNKGGRLNTGFVIVYWKTIEGIYANCEKIDKIVPCPYLLKQVELFCYIFEGCE
jgi:hypothetical protein